MLGYSYPGIGRTRSDTIMCLQNRIGHAPVAEVEWRHQSEYWADVGIRAVLLMAIFNDVTVSVTQKRKTRWPQFHSRRTRQLDGMMCTKARSYRYLLGSRRHRPLGRQRVAKLESRNLYRPENFCVLAVPLRMLAR